MRAGDLRQLVTIQRRAVGQDQDGQNLNVWRPLLTVRAMIETLTAHELIAAQAQNILATHKVTVRYTPVLMEPTKVADKRITFRDRVFEVKGSANVDELNREIWMLVSEGLTQG